MVANAFVLDNERVAEFARANGIRKLSLFGSVLRSDFRPDSDLDVLVEFFPGQEPGLIDMARMERELTDIARRKVDLRTPEDLSRYFRDEVVASAELQYVAA